MGAGGDAADGEPGEDGAGGNGDGDLLVGLLVFDLGLRVDATVVDSGLVDECITRSPRTIGPPKAVAALR